jgi:hypothetical protein
MPKLEKFAARPKSVVVVLHSNDVLYIENLKRTVAFLPKKLS